MNRNRAMQPLPCPTVQPAPGLGDFKVAETEGLSRRSFLLNTSALAGAIAAGAFSFPGFASSASAASDASLSDLPAGAAPKALSFPHFPDRLHAFIWRNWELAPTAVLARVVRAEAADIRRMGRAMGLSDPPRITAEQRARSYITVIRRNWHLLPYEQLLELLEWSPGQLAYTLREDDFLYVKLGNLKPKCEPLRYVAPGPEALAREREIAELLRTELGEQGRSGREPLFEFVKKLSAKPPSAAPVGAKKQLKYCYSYFALYGDPLLDAEADPYPGGYLARLAALGVTGVWLQGVLQKLAPFPWDAALSAGYEKRLRNLSKLVARAKEHGIRVLLYLNEPRSMPLRFFEKNPGLKGTVEGDHAALCTSVPEVQAWIVDSVAKTASAVPDLGGFFSITASENFTNCWSHGGGGQCPKCAGAGAPAVIAGVNGLFARGIAQAKASGSKAELIAWDWGWDDGWAPEAIKQLPDETAFMSVSEWRLPVERGGIKTEVGEYSISAVGPGPRAQKHWQIARERGLKTFAKIQAGNTWELSAVPYIPALENVARHAEALSRLHVDGIMLGWTLGGYPSPNLEIVSDILGAADSGSMDPATAMERVAGRRFGKALAPVVVRAWREFSSAFSQFPLHPGVLYNAPQQVGPANLLWEKATGYGATMVGFPYDDLNAWRGPYPAEVFAKQFEKVAAGFEGALAELRQAAASALGKETEAHKAAFESECRVAETAAIHFRSAANQARFVMARQVGSAVGSTGVDGKTLEKILRSEMALARRLHQIQSGDSRMGFEASNQYYYVPLDLAEKIVNCRYLLDTWLPTLAPRRS